MQQKKRVAAVLFIAAVLLMLFTAGCGAGQAQEDIVVLYTGDVHCGIEENIGYAGLGAYKEQLQEQTPHVFLIDTGDAVQGDFISMISEGGYVVDIMSQTGYDFAVPGNHEFDYGLDGLQALIERAEFPYLSCNITYSGEKEHALEAIRPYEIVDCGNVSLAFIGVTTPETLGSTAPGYFMEDGQYVYGFTGENDGADLYDCEQSYVDACRTQGADYVVVAAHLGDGEEYGSFSSNALAQNTEGIDVILDGHAHSTISCYVETNKKGEQVLISTTGTKFANIGQLVITADGHISTGLISAYPEKDAEIEQYIDTIQAAYEADLAKVAGTSETVLTGYSETGARLVRNRETNIGNFCADAYRAAAGADIALVNGGGIRADFPAGDITYKYLFDVHPFGNTLCMVEATGQEILDCLETCYRFVLPIAEEHGNAVGEDGGFQQVSGLQFVIDTSIPSSVTVDENGMLVSIDGPRRVKDVMVLNAEGVYEPLDAGRVYTVASHSHLLKDSGSGCNMFVDNHFIIDEGMADYQILVTYMTDYLNGHIDERYAGTEGRITVK